MTRDMGSFRDPSGYVFIDGDVVVRTVNASAAEAFRAFHANGLYDALAKEAMVISCEEMSLTDSDRERFVGPRNERPRFAIRHPRVPFISYPYEWTFGQLKGAALGHLRIQLLALDRGFVLSDASAYNMQFIAGRPVHIDVLSFRPYREGEVWAGYNQFCRQFLLPLLIEAWSGVPFQLFLRARIDGVELREAARLLPWRYRWLSLQGLLHVTLHAKSELQHSSDQMRADPAKVPDLPRSRYRTLLSELQAWLAGLGSGRSDPSFWKNYDGLNTYTDAMARTKHDFVIAMVRRSGAKRIWDIGGNSGDYSASALEAGAEHAVVLDTDLDSLERAYERSKRTHPGILPILMDCADPSSNRGWDQSERKGLKERANADAVLALAVTHHLAIGKNIPLASVLHWLVSLAPAGVIEFVPKTDPMVRQMLTLRDDVFSDYSEESFRAALSEVSSIRSEHRFAENGRLLVEFVRK